MVSKWKTLSSKTLIHNKLFDLKEEKVLSPENNEFPVWVMESPAWINIIPVTKDREVIMIKQYRFGNKEITLEIPGGMSEQGEDPMQAAIREMLEETGYTSTNVLEIGSASPNPALMSNQVISYLALDVEFIKKQNLDTMEDIEVVKINLDDIPLLIDDKTIDHSLVISAFYFYERFKKNNYL